jgi:aromatase
LEDTVSQSILHEVEHDVTVSAPAAEVYRLIEDVTSWPRLFPPAIHVDRVPLDDGEERIQIWATANDEVKNWTSRRRLDRAGLRIAFRQETPAPPVAAMGGTWFIEPNGDQECRIRLLHDYSAIDDDPEKLRWIDTAVDTNSRTELAALKTNVEQVVGLAPDLVLSFEDSLSVDGSMADVYDFLNDAQLWRERLPHVTRVLLTEPSPGVQELEMDTRSPDGSVHTTKSVRVCFPPDRIVYKQIRLPALMSLHTGAWRLVDNGGQVRVTSQHTVVIEPDAITRVLGPDAGVAQARAFLRNALGANSRATLGHAKAYAEAPEARR